MAVTGSVLGVGDGNPEWDEATEDLPLRTPESPSASTQQWEAKQLIQRREQVKRYNSSFFLKGKSHSNFPFRVSILEKCGVYWCPNKQQCHFQKCRVVAVQSLILEKGRVVAVHYLHWRRWGCCSTVSYLDKCRVVAVQPLICKDVDCCSTMSHLENGRVVALVQCLIWRNRRLYCNNLHFSKWEVVLQQPCISPNETFYCSNLTFSKLDIVLQQPFFSPKREIVLWQPYISLNEALCCNNLTFLQMALVFIGASENVWNRHHVFLELGHKKGNLNDFFPSKNLWLYVIHLYALTHRSHT